MYPAIRRKLITFLNGLKVASLKKRLISILVLLTALPLLVFSIFSIYMNDQELQKNANQLSANNAQEVQDKVRMLINQHFEVINTFAQTDVFKSTNPNNLAVIKSFLVATAKASPEAQSVTYLDSTGQQRARADDKEMIKNLS